MKQLNDYIETLEAEINSLSVEIEQYLQGNPKGELAAMVHYRKVSRRAVLKEVLFQLKMIKIKS